jgi:hypothetical protein
MRLCVASRSVALLPCMLAACIHTHTSVCVASAVVFMAGLHLQSDPVGQVVCVSCLKLTGATLCLFFVCHDFMGSLGVGAACIELQAGHRQGWGAQWLCTGLAARRGPCLPLPFTPSFMSAPLVFQLCLQARLPHDVWDCQLQDQRCPRQVFERATWRVVACGWLECGAAKGQVHWHTVLVLFGVGDTVRPCPSRYIVYSVMPCRQKQQQRCCCCLASQDRHVQLLAANPHRMLQGCRVAQSARDRRMCSPSGGTLAGTEQVGCCCWWCLRRTGAGVCQHTSCAVWGRYWCCDPAGHPVRNLQLSRQHPDQSCLRLGNKVNMPLLSTKKRTSSTMPLFDVGRDA